ncbi:MAG: radical SAM/SPASM domain-containing protein [Bacteroidales bacterium]|jgi:wyosine [tRNA(Phe)-imidazoG37] synthetase (radical SAM superfamily)
MRNKNFKYKVYKYALNKFPERKLFCSLPFKHMEIFPDGQTNLCCYIKKSPGVVKNDNLLEIYNSKDAHEIRESILDGTFKYCDLISCPHFSSGNLPLQDSCKTEPFSSYIKNHTTKLDELNLWLSFDSRCNLNCITCRNDLIKYSEEENLKAEKFMQIVKNNLTEIHNLGITGSGDPFASQVFRDFLYNLDSSQYPDLKIFILTNGLLLNEKTWELMHKAHSSIASIQISIDASKKETYEKIRIGGNFDKLLSNVKFVSQLRKQGKISEFIISFVVNALNYKEMKDFINLGIEFSCEQVYFSFTCDWGVLSKDKYNELAIHLPEHKEHYLFLEELKNPVFNNSIVNLGNIKYLKLNPLLRNSLFS